MGGKTKPPYPEAFRQEIVELVAGGREVGELARDFNVSPQRIHDWVKKAWRLADLPSGTVIIKAHRAVKVAVERNALIPAEREELQRLRRENRPLKRERDVLSKATTWLARKSEQTPLGSIDRWIGLWRTRPTPK
jgi:transposase